MAPTLLPSPSPSAVPRDPTATPTKLSTIGVDLSLDMIGLQCLDYGRAEASVVRIAVAKVANITVEYVAANATDCEDISGRRERRRHLTAYALATVLVSISVPRTMGTTGADFSEALGKDLSVDDLNDAIALTAAANGVVSLSSSVSVQSFHVATLAPTFAPTSATRKDEGIDTFVLLVVIAAGLTAVSGIVVFAIWRLKSKSSKYRVDQVYPGSQSQNLEDEKADSELRTYISERAPQLLVYIDSLVVEGWDSLDSLALLEERQILESAIITKPGHQQLFIEIAQALRAERGGMPTSPLRPMRDGELDADRLEAKRREDEIEQRANDARLAAEDEERANRLQMHFEARVRVADEEAQIKHLHDEIKARSKQNAEEARRLAAEEEARLVRLREESEAEQRRIDEMHAEEERLKWLREAAGAEAARLETQRVAEEARMRRALKDALDAENRARQLYEEEIVAARVRQRQAEENALAKRAEEDDETRRLQNKAEVEAASAKEDQEQLRERQEHEAEAKQTHFEQEQAERLKAEEEQARDRRIQDAADALERERETSRAEAERRLEEEHREKQACLEVEQREQARKKKQAEEAERARSAAQRAAEQEAKKRRLVEQAEMAAKAATPAPPPTDSVRLDANREEYERPRREAEARRAAAKQETIRRIEEEAIEAKRLDDMQRRKAQRAAQEQREAEALQKAEDDARLRLHRENGRRAFERKAQREEATAKANEEERAQEAEAAHKKDAEERARLGSEREDRIKANAAGNDAAKRQKILQEQAAAKAAKENKRKAVRANAEAKGRSDAEKYRQAQTSGTPVRTEERAAGQKFLRGEQTRQAGGLPPRAPWRAGPKPTAAPPSTAAAAQTPTARASSPTQERPRSAGPQRRAIQPQAQHTPENKTGHSRPRSARPQRPSSAGVQRRVVPDGHLHQIAVARQLSTPEVGEAQLRQSGARRAPITPAAIRRENAMAASAAARQKDGVDFRWVSPEEVAARTARQAATPATPTAQRFNSLSLGAQNHVSQAQASAPRRDDAVAVRSRERPHSAGPRRTGLSVSQDRPLSAGTRRKPPPDAGLRGKQVHPGAGGSHGW